MGRNIASKRIVAGVLVALFFGIALYLRIVLPYDKVFVGDWIKLTSNDPYYFMRHIDNIVHHFPQAISFDPYLRFPSGFHVNAEPFVYFVASIAWLTGDGSPSQNTVDVIGVYLPAVIGALTVIPVYFIGKELFHRWAGVIAAALIAILPGEFLGTSMLGYTDRNALQVLLTCLVMLFLILAFKNSIEKKLSFSTLQRGNFSIFIKPLIYSLLAGIFLGLYLLLWKGAFIFVFVIILTLIIQTVYDYIKQKPIDPVIFSATILFLSALLIYLPFSASLIYQVSSVIALVIPVALYLISLVTKWRKLKPYYYPLALIVFAVIAAGILFIINPDIVKSIIGSFRQFTGDTSISSIQEMRPILFPSGEFTFHVVWQSYTTASILSLIALIILVYKSRHIFEPQHLLFIIWSLISLLATLALVRFAAFFSINVVLLTGYLSWLVLQWGGLRDTMQPDTAITLEPRPRLKAKKARRRQRPRAQGNTARTFGIVLILIALFFVVYYPNIGPAVATAGSAEHTPSNGWYESLYWLKGNSPEPFTDKEFYYQYYETPFKYPDTAYGVISWWDYGYLIARVAQRPVVCDPGGGNQSRTVAAAFFTAQDESAANKIAQKLKTRYVIIDTQMVMGKFYAMATYAGKDKSEFYDTYYEQRGEKLVEGTLFYPEYYRSTAVRLYNFDGAAVIPRSTTVITYEEKTNNEGKTYKHITGERGFNTYEEAVKYTSLQTASNVRIVGKDPFYSAVPLEKLEHYEPVYSSKRSRVQLSSSNTVPEVKIFEYTK